MGNTFSCFNIQRRNAESTAASVRIAPVEDENNNVEGADGNASDISNLPPPSLSDQDLPDTQFLEAFRDFSFFRGDLHRTSPPILPSNLRTAIGPSTPIPYRRSDSPRPSRFRPVGDPFQSSSPIPPRNASWSPALSEMENLGLMTDSPMAAALGHWTPAYRRYPPWIQFSQDDAVLMAAAPSLASPEESSSSIKCPVCLDELLGMTCTGKRVMSTVCGHIFCYSCLLTCIWSNGRCPTCRRMLNFCDIHPIFI